MLEGIIEHDHIGLIFADRQHAGRKPVFSDNNRHTFQAAGDHVWLVAGLFGIHVKCPAVADNTPVFFSTSLVAPADNHDFKSGALDLCGHMNGHGGFAGASHRDVADGYHLARQIAGWEHLVPVTGCSQPLGSTVKD